MNTGHTYTQSNCYSPLAQEEREQILRDMWLRHDAMWFEFVVKRLGSSEANTGNLRIVERLAEYEMLILMRKIRVNARDVNIDAVIELFKIGLDLYQTSLSPVDVIKTAEDRMTISLYNCWAFKAISGAGMLEEYHCGPWRRLRGWFRALNIDPDIRPDPLKCLALVDGNAANLCQIEVFLPTP